MTERFYDITHLTTDELREMFSSYRKYGWVDFEYAELRPDAPPAISDADIVLNVQADNEGNYFVFMLGVEEEKNGVMIGFGLTYHDDFSAFLHLPPKFLAELVEKYNLGIPKEAMDYTVKEFLIDEYLRKPQN